MGYDPDENRVFFLIKPSIRQNLRLYQRLKVRNFLEQKDLIIDRLLNILEENQL